MKTSFISILLMIRLKKTMIYRYYSQSAKTCQVEN